MIWMKYLFLVGLFIRAVYTDMKSEKIENTVVLIGLLAGLVFAVIGGGWAGLIQSIKMAGIVFIALFFLFVIHGLGAGDIKLFCVTATFFPEKAITILAGSFLVGGIFGMVRMIGRWRRKEVVSLKETIHFSIPIAVGTILAQLWR